jgi:hypothetical protein
MDAKIVEITIKAHLKEMSDWLSEAAGLATPRGMRRSWQPAEDDRGCASSPPSNGRRLADQLRPYNITVNSIATGDTRTERFVATRAVDPKRMVESGTLDRIAIVDEIARVIELFAGPMGAFISGQVIRVDGGEQLWPG